MHPIPDSSPSVSTLTPLVEVPAAIQARGGQAPDVSTIRGHGYRGRFNMIRMSSGKWAVPSADLPAIAAQYGAPAGNVEAAA